MSKNLFLLLFLIVISGTVVAEDAPVEFESSQWRSSALDLRIIQVKKRLLEIVSEMLVNAHGDDGKQDLLDFRDKLVPTLVTNGDVDKNSIVLNGVFTDLRSALESEKYKTKKNPIFNRMLESFASALISEIEIREHVYKFPLQLGAYDFASSRIKYEKIKSIKDVFDLLETELSTTLKSLNENISKSPDLGAPSLFASLYSQASSNGLDAIFDPIMQGNYPYKRMVLKNKGEESICLHLATPTIRSNESVEITPEFLAHLRNLKMKGEHQFYINFQKNGAPTAWELMKYFGIEYYRAQCLQGLNTVPELQGVIDVMTLDKNSEFYWQNAKDAMEFVSLNSFWEELEQKLFCEACDSGFYWPEALKGKQREIRGVLKQLKSVLYADGADSLNAQKRKDSIELVYLFLMGKLSVGSKIINFSCKDDIDRGAGAKSLFLLATILKEVIMNAEKFLDNPYLLQERVEMLLSLVFADALMAKQRPLLEERLQRFQQAAVALVKSLRDNPEFFIFFRNNFSFDQVSFK
ncbi:MAG: hypothetical protein HQK50_13360 [Oligoflexia bacterium]|nr:hypothetical protein [Oligoflexia bacterium]MBF0366554.1 hypothetical protein [Oligoflexia bacterium]